MTGTHSRQSRPLMGMVGGRGFGCEAQRQRHLDYYADASPYGVRVGPHRDVRDGRGWWLTAEEALELADLLTEHANWVNRYAPEPEDCPHANVPIGQLRPDGLLQTVHGPIHPEEWGN